MLKPMHEIHLEKAPIFIVGHHKTGTTLLRSLFDGHPDLLTYPIELKFFSYAPFDTQMPDLKLEVGSTPEETAYNLVNGRFFQMFLDKKLPRAIQFDANSVIDTGVNREKFLEWYFRNKFMSYQDIIIRCFSSFVYSQGKNPEDISKVHLVEKTPLQEEYASLLASWFPNAIFIHIVRNPYATYTTMCLRKGFKTDTGRQKVVDTMTLSHYYGIQNSNALDNYYIIRYEDLIQNPKEIMKLLSEKIGINYADTMNHPTVCGTPYLGNSMYNHVHSGVDHISLNRWMKEISIDQLRTVNIKLEQWISDYNYEQIDEIRLKQMRDTVFVEGERS